MAQSNTTSDDNKSKHQRPEPVELRTSIPDQHGAESEPLNNTYNLSPAERYIIQQAQMMVDPNESQSGTTSISSTTTSSISHAEKMNEWREKEINNIYKHEPYRYKYGTPPSTSNRSTFRRIDVQTEPNKISSFSTVGAEKK